MLMLNIFQKKFKKLCNKNMATNICKNQTNYSISCGYICIGFIDFIKGESLLDYTNIFFPNWYGKNDKINLKYF